MKKISLTLGIMISQNLMGSIRYAYLNGDKMEVINLKLGNTTVLDFVETPQEIVCGNSNYFNIEKSKKNNSLSIQALNKVETNLFVQTPYHRFGFLLRVNEFGTYDDLVKVRWKSEEFVKPKENKKMTSAKLMGKIDFNDFKVDLKNLIYDETRQLQILEFEVLNKSKMSLELKNLNVFLSRNQKELKVLNIVSQKDILESNSSTLTRILFKTENLDFSFNIKFKEIHKKLIIPRRSL